MFWTSNFCKNDFKSTYYQVKSHLLGLPNCGISSCKGVSVIQRKEMGKEDQEGLGNVAATSKKKDEGPLPFLRKPSTIRPPFPPSRGHTHPAKKRPSSSGLGPMDKIFQQEAREEVDLTIAFFFYLNFISFNVARSPLFFEMC